MRLEKDNVPLHHWQSTVQCFIYITIFFIFDFSVQPCQSIVPVAMNIVFFSFLLLLFFSSPRAQHRTNGYSSLFNFFFLFPCCSALIDFGLGQFVVVCLLQPRSNYCRTNSPSTSSLSIHEQKKNNRNWLRYMALCSTVFWPLAIYSLLCCVFSYGHSAKRIRSGHMDMKYNNK